MVIDVSVFMETTICAWRKRVPAGLPILEPRKGNTKVPQLVIASITLLKPPIATVTVHIILLCRIPYVAVITIMEQILVILTVTANIICSPVLKIPLTAVFR